MTCLVIVDVQMGLGSRKAMHDHAWTAMAIHGHVWRYMAMRSHVWPCKDYVIFDAGTVKKIVFAVWRWPGFF